MSRNPACRTASRGCMPLLPHACRLLPAPAPPSLRLRPAFAPPSHRLRSAPARGSIKVIIGCSVISIAWAVGSDALGLDAGLRFTFTYLIAGVPIAILAIGSVAPGLLFPPRLTRASLSRGLLRTVKRRAGYAYQPPACRAYRRRSASTPPTHFHGTFTVLSKYFHASTPPGGPTLTVLSCLYSRYCRLVLTVQPASCQMPACTHGTLTFLLVLSRYFHGTFTVQAGRCMQAARRARPRRVPACVDAPPACTYVRSGRAVRAACRTAGTPGLLGDGDGVITSVP